MIEFIFDLFNMFLYMITNIKILTLYGIFLASFSLIPKVKSYYLTKNFVLIWFVSGFLFGSVLFCCSYVLLIVLSGSNYFFIIEWLMMYGITSYPIVMISSILLTLIRFLMIKDTTDANPLNKQQIRIVCIVSCVNCALSPIFYIMFLLF
ncbi:hypothetical protein [Helicobacter sp. T3_23-1059]